MKSSIPIVLIASLGLFVELSAQEILILPTPLATEQKGPTATKKNARQLRPNRPRRPRRPPRKPRILRRSPAKPPKEPEWHWGLNATLELVTINLTTRTTETGFAPGLAFGTRWQPPWWTVSESFLGIDLLVDAKFQDLNKDEKLDYFRINALPVFTIAGLITGGVGISYNLALDRDSKDTMEFICTFGLSTPVGFTGGK